MQNSTREQLLRAAEMLFARDGLENVPVRAIIRAAGARNESALHYHFENKKGLINALVTQRVEQIIARRTALIDRAMAGGGKPGVREMCMLMVKPPFDLCGSDKGFRDFLGVFGARHVNVRGAISAHLAERKGSRVAEVESLLRCELRHLPEVLFRLRMDHALRFATLMLSHRAREGGTFRGKSARVFIHDLADTMAGLLAAPVSEETRAVLND